MMQKQALTVVAESDRQVDLIRRETEAGESARQVLVKIDTSVHETENALQQIVQGIRLQTEHIQKTYEQARRIADTAKALSGGQREYRRRCTGANRRYARNYRLLRDAAGGSGDSSKKPLYLNYDKTIDKICCAHPKEADRKRLKKACSRPLCG